MKSSSLIILLLMCISFDAYAQSPVFDYEIVEGDTIYKFSETPPEFPGGLVALINYLQNNLEYPKAARKAKVEGIVYIRFVVMENGSVAHVNILHGIGKGCEEEAKRVVEQMPVWQPGTIGGEAVAVQYTLPISFRLR